MAQVTHVESAARVSRRVNVALAVVAVGFLIVLPLEVWFRV